MSNATKCDRCGGFYEQGGKAIRQGFGSDMEEFDLCPDCAKSFDAWLERGQMADASERVTKSVEMLHDTREKLEDDVREFSYQDPNLHTSELVITHAPMYTVLEWLDRQAAITEREFFETACHGCERLGGDGRPTLDELSDELRKYIVKADRLGAALDERDDQLADARESLEAAWDDNAELGGQVDTLKAKLDAEAQHAREAWQLWGEADARAEQAETERDEMAQRIQTLELEIAKHHKRIAELEEKMRRQAESIGEWELSCESLEVERDKLQREIATLKEHRAGNMERLREFTDANAEMAWRIQQLEKEVSR